MLQRLGIQADVYLQGISWLEALESKGKGVANHFKTLRMEHQLSKLGDYDLFVLSDTMRAFQTEVNLQPLLKTSKPIIHYEVFYAGGSGYWMERLPTGALDKYDGYLVASGIHGTNPIDSSRVFPIGLDLLPRHPFLTEKSEFTALLDFPRESHEEQRAIQENALRRLGIRTLRLKGEYSYAEIEKIYQQTSIGFVSSPEAFGIPIVQLQHYGAYIASPDRMWVMRHALLPPGAAYFNEPTHDFTENFCFYRDEEDLTGRLNDLMKRYDPSIVRGRFLKFQPEYAQGDLDILWEAIRRFC